MSNFGYWIFGRDMLNVNIKSLNEKGVTDVFLNYYAFETHGENKVLSWIQEANCNNIRTHIWCQCFYDGEWHNPKTTNLTPKIEEIKKYANMKGVTGVHMDYLRYPGNAYETSGGAEAITQFAKKVKESVPNNINVSCAVMPESETKKYYGQDIDELGKIVDFIVPMQYKGNYKQGNEWLISTTKQFSSKATIWSGLQSYKSDNDTSKLPINELVNDIKSCMNNGADGVILFRYGLSENVDFKTLKSNSSNGGGKVQKYISRENIVKMARDVKSYVEKNGRYLYKGTYGGVEFTWNEMQDIMTYAVLYPSNGVKADTYKWCENASGDNIVENIYKEDYLDQCKRVRNFILTKGKVPNYVTTVKSKKRVNIDLYTYCIAKIIVWYADHDNTYPNYCTYDYNALSPNPSPSGGIKKYGRSSKTGCDNRGQNNDYYCGPHMVQEIIRNLTGVVISQSKLAGVMGTTTAGTGHSGIDTGLAWINKNYDFTIEWTWKNFSDLGWSGIKKILESNNQDCGIHELYKDTWGHYTNYDKVYDNTVDVHNSLGDYCGSGCHCGYTENRSKSTAIRYINGISQKSVLVVTRKK